MAGTQDVQTQAWKPATASTRLRAWNKQATQFWLIIYGDKKGSQLCRQYPFCTIHKLALTLFWFWHLQCITRSVHVSPTNLSYLVKLFLKPGLHWAHLSCLVPPKADIRKANSISYGYVSVAFFTDFRLMIWKKGWTQLSSLPQQCPKLFHSSSNLWFRSRVNIVAIRLTGLSKVSMDIGSAWKYWQHRCSGQVDPRVDTTRRSSFWNWLWSITTNQDSAVANTVQIASACRYKRSHRMSF